MDAKQEQAFRTETARTVNILTAALRDCFNWHLENEGEEGVATVEQVLKSTVEFAALANFGAKLVMQHTGKRIIFVKAGHPLSGWVPETMMFLVHPDLVQTWKEQLLHGIAMTSADLLDELAEMQVEEGDDAQPEPQPEPQPESAPLAEATNEGGENA